MEQRAGFAGTKKKAAAKGPRSNAKTIKAPKIPQQLNRVLPSDDKGARDRSWFTAAWRQAGHKDQTRYMRENCSPV